MIQLYECPTCGRDSAAFAEIEATGKIVCPACAPTPDSEPHDYRPVMLGGVALRDAEYVVIDEVRADWDMIEVYYKGRVLQISVELLRDPHFPTGEFVLRKLVDRE